MMRWVRALVGLPAWLRGLCFVGACVGEGVYFLARKTALCAEMAAMMTCYEEMRGVLRQNAMVTEWKQRQQMQEANWVETVLMGYRPLQTERAALRVLGTHPALTPRREVMERLSLLDNENRIVFKEEKRRELPYWQESELCLQHPVEIDVQDLEYLCSQIEGVPVGKALPCAGRPDLVPLDWTLSATERGFMWNMRCMQRK